LKTSKKEKYGCASLLAWLYLSRQAKRVSNKH
jgi:hypothetical protein